MSHFPKFFTTALASTIGLASIFTPNVATASWFEIELVIFERHDETSRESWSHQAPNINTQHAINIEMARLMPNYPQCPQLDQEQVRQIISEQPIELSPDLDVIRCIIPQIELPPLNNLAPQLAEHQPTLSEQLTGADNAQSTALIEKELQLKLPSQFHFEQQQYRVVSPARILEKIPTRVSSEALETELIAPHLLDPATLQLTDLVKKLRWHKNLTPKLHIGWRQNVLPRHLATPVHIFAGKNFANDYNMDGSLIDKTPSISNVSDLSLGQSNFETVVNSHTDIIPKNNILKDNAPIWEINGLFKVYLNKYLFIETNFNRKIATTIDIAMPTEIIPVGLNYDTPEQDSISLIKSEALIESDVIELDMMEQPTVAVPWLVNHPLQQHRRVKSKQIHYFDHPDYGIVVQIRRFSLETAVEQ